MAKLLDYEWKFLLQLVSRIDAAEGYEETCRVLMEHLQTVLPFDRAFCLRIGREEGRVSISEPVNYRLSDDYSVFLNGSYPRWSEFIMSPSSMVFSQSELVEDGEHWERSRVYREIWQPRDIYWGLFSSVIYQDQPLILLGLFRQRGKKDFSERDRFILLALQDALEQRFSRLLMNEKPSSNLGLKKVMLPKAASLGLTKRETEITDLICQGYSSEQICGQLYISPATLNKHLSNIYCKTGVKNRIRLISLMME